MGLYVHPGDADALRSVDLRELERLVDEAVWQSRSGELHSLRLASCGQYVSGRLYRFDQAIAAHNKAKAAKKRAETAVQVRRAGMDLVQAVRDMKNRMEEEQQEQELFVVEDSVMHPYRFTPRMNVRVSYRWRGTADESWTYGSINFLHEVDTRPDYTLPTPKRKPSRAKQEDEFQDKLYRVWDHLRSSALHSLREYLKSGRDRSAIPENFQVTTDSYTRGLNNYSTQFWREQP
ncbi:MAG: hypothetical protein CVT77_05345 [Alphaproteobacteria bacterium HGW-Alphaproteobacteria-16]|nr:MAG: hypothetical protein CVT77_05345 [Alphaproteobacteria bacterium HGW-Alphaproteobacteria-16]